MIRITINTDAGAFQDGNAAYEVARILRELSIQIQSRDMLHAGDVMKLYDINGNACGNMKVES